VEALEKEKVSERTLQKGAQEYRNKGFSGEVEVGGWWTASFIDDSSIKVNGVKRKTGRFRASGGLVRIMTA
jgi:hypothetical protein